MGSNPISEMRRNFKALYLDDVTARIYFMIFK